MWVLIMQIGKLVHTEGIESPCGEKIKEIDRDIGYKYLGILEADDTEVDIYNRIHKAD